MNATALGPSSNFSGELPADALFLLTFLVGVPIHSYVIWLIVTGSGVASEIFFFSLSVCEMGSSLNTLLNALSDMFMYFDTLSKSLQAVAGIFGILSNFLQGLAISGRPVFQILMCVERFLAVVHPVTFLKLKPLRYRIFCCSVAWSFTLASCVSCSFILDKGLSAYTWFFCVQFILFVSIQLYFCVTVLGALRQSGPVERKEENHRKRRAFNLILITTVSMFITYVPFIIYGSVCILTGQEKSFRNIRQQMYIGLFFFLVSGFVQSFLFLHRNEKCC